MRGAARCAALLLYHLSWAGAGEDAFAGTLAVTRPFAGDEPFAVTRFTTEASRSSQGVSHPPARSSSPVGTYCRLDGFRCNERRCFPAKGSCPIVDKSKKCGASPRCGCDYAKARCLVLVTVSQHYLEMFANWMMAFGKLGMAVDLQVVAEDPESCRWLGGEGRDFLTSKRNASAITIKCASNVTLPGAIRYGSAGFKELMHRRGEYMHAAVLERCCVVFSDLDAFWLRDPLPRLLRVAQQGDCALLAQMHGTFKPSKSMNPAVLVSFWGHGGAAADVMRFWARSMLEPTVNLFKFNAAVRNRARGRACFLPTAEFPEGNDIRWSHQWLAQKRPYVVHANWIPLLALKIDKLRSAGLWADVRITLPNVTATLPNATSPKALRNPVRRTRRPGLGETRRPGHILDKAP
ncbi:hypothetical protein M885DRAFT_503998 [Pelagophyceae sp. CCMP2097]|nr:hypothetical protein M885DRAFT_503998 [Pelagophyceae sp. CCMP2097]